MLPDASSRSQSRHQPAIRWKTCWSVWRLKKIKIKKKFNYRFQNFAKKFRLNLYFDNENFLCWKFILNKRTPFSQFQKKSFFLFFIEIHDVKNETSPKKLFFCLKNFSIFFTSNIDWFKSEILQFKSFFLMETFFWKTIFQFRNFCKFQFFDAI